MKHNFLRFAAICTTLLLAFTAFGATRYVDANGTNPVSPYANWSTAATNIQDAVNGAHFSDTILVTNGVYQYGGATLQGTSQSNRVYVPFGSALKVQSVNGPAVTIIKGHQVPGTTNGASAVRCVYLTEFSSLSGFTLTNGATVTFEHGGGVVCESSCVVSNCIITGNAANNSGGGVSGGILINCRVIGNSALGGNSPGGGVFGSLLTNCVVAGNFAGYIGGGALGSTLVNCTVVSNTAAAYAGSLSGCTSKNCIVYYNSTYYTNDDANIGNGFTNCCVSVPTNTIFGANNFTNPPMFLDLAGGDYHLNAASPCINAGSNSLTTSSIDLDGNPRIAAGRVDLGAFEFQAPVHYVSLNSAAPVSPFASWTTAATNIQDAIDASVTGDFVVVSNGTYSAGGRAIYGAATNRVNLDKAITVQSVNGPATTSIKGDYTAPTHGGPNSRCAYLTDGAMLAGFTLTNGGTAVTANTVLEVNGGGVWCESSGATVSNCVLTGNTSLQYGGGAFRGTLFNCVITNNFGGHGGGACSNTLVNCTVTRNVATFQSLDSGGGAIYSALSNCLVVANSCNGGGGGAAFSLLSGCVVSNNVGNSGGGGVCMGAAYNCLISSNRTFSTGGGAYSNTLVNCVLKNNLANSGGGGARWGTLYNCTIAGNTSLQTGGGTYQGTLYNCIVYYNTANSSSTNYFNSTLNYCDTTPLPAGFGNITNDPVFINLAGGDFHLQGGSPCINSGNNAYVTNTTDRDGNARIAGGTVDMGAYEFQSPLSTVSYAYLQQYGLPTDGSADNADTDGDGTSNYAEWRAGTSPTDAASLLQMMPVAPDNSSGATLTWQSVSGVNYLVQRGSDLNAQPVFSTIQSNIVGQAVSTSYLDTTATNGGPYYYRVGVQ